jgi:nucleoid-associated protein YgaU
VRRRLEQAQSEVARLTGARGIYTVQPADSLSSIAVFFYRNADRWPAILEANAHLIYNPDLIFPGMVLIVPEVAGNG